MENFFKIHYYVDNQLHIFKIFVPCFNHKAVFPVTIHAKQKHLGCKKVRGQSEATL